MTTTTIPTLDTRNRAAALIHATGVRIADVEKALAGAEVGRRYRLQRVSDRGSISTRWAAEDTLHGHRVEVEIPAPALLLDGGFLAAFRVDARDATAAQHPNVARVLGVGFHRGVPYAVRPAPTGQTLRGHLQRAAAAGRALDLEKLIGRMEAMAHGIDTLHRAGHVLRSLRPEHISFDAAGEARLADSFHARVIAKDAQPGRALGSLPLGAPAYMAPEQLRGHSIGAAADRYALAAILFECATGRPLHHGDTPFEILAGRNALENPELHRIAAALPQPIQEALAAALDVRPSARPASCAALLGTLRNALIRAARMPKPTASAAKSTKRTHTARPAHAVEPTQAGRPTQGAPRREPTSAPAPAARRKAAGLPRFAIGCGIAAAIAPVLPWILPRTGSFNQTINGFAPDLMGPATLLAGILLAALAAARQRGFAALAAIGAIGAAGWDTFRIFQEGLHRLILPGPGIWVAIAAGAAALFSLRRR